MAEKYEPKMEDLSNIQDLIGDLDDFPEPPSSLTSAGQTEQCTAEKNICQQPKDDSNDTTVPSGEDVLLEQDDNPRNSSSESHSRTELDKTEILDFGDTGFLLHQVLNEVECQYYISKGEEIGFGSIKDVKDSYRRSQRYVGYTFCYEMYHGSTL